VGEKRLRVQAEGQEIAVIAGIATWSPWIGKPKGFYRNGRKGRNGTGRRVLHGGRGSPRCDRKKKSLNA